MGGLCPSCLLAAGLKPDDDPLETVIRDEDSDAGAMNSDPGGTSRFTPGTTLAGRFRITGMIGSGGMGEVYRADDLKLGQPVALKFLSPSFGATRDSLARLYEEVRLGRQVAHPNVCRIYDVVEFDQHPCIVMEYVDGEDLASLLERIGRLTQRKAAAISRDLCEGLAASHHAGIIHGDLKPANIMIDGRGRARVMDFGLSRRATEAGGATLAGTPAYMAPEQLEGGPPSAAADVYALGLIGYELFTGEKAREGRSLADFRANAAKRVIPPSAQGVHIDPAIEAIILDCLDPDPSRRPATAAHILKRFPGGDPLDQAIAAGETPSPELVAAAERKEELSPSRAWALLAAIFGALILLVFAAQRSSLHLEEASLKPPAALADRAEELAKSFGFPKAVDRASWFGTERDVPGAGLATSSAEGRLLFFYRQSAAPLFPLGDFRIGWGDPPVDSAGMVNLGLDGSGRLRVLRARVDGATPGTGEEEPWARLFDAAALDLSSFREVSSVWSPPDPFDAKKEWRAPSGDVVRAAMRNGRPTWFSMTSASAAAGRRRGDSSPIPAATYLVVLAASLVAGAILARRNIRLRRADHRGAQRTALSVFVCSLVYWLFSADHSPSLEIESRMAAAGLGEALFVAARVWLGYMALEPYVRRKLPALIIGWNRLVSGRLRDPIVGRDLLVGSAAGIAAVCIEHLRYWIPPLLGAPTPPPGALALGPLSSFGEALGIIFYAETRAVFLAFFGLFLLLLLRLALRRSWAAALAWLVIVSVIWTPMDLPLVDVPLSIVRIALFFLVLTRGGLLSFATALYLSHLLAYLPWLSSPGQWWAGHFAVMTVALVVIAVWGYRAAVARHSILRRPALDF
ncbi:MAG TPA: serine/threonine-protein kinase [Thermoanaerobaculia bacterium]|nr:serine/threonine-protein kinase [Thermoanaerobaculia bacterium]